MNPATFHTVVGICSALFSPDYPVEDKMHKAQACEVFQQYCSEPPPTETTRQSDAKPWFDYENRRSSGRKHQRREE